MLLDYPKMLHSFKTFSLKLAYLTLLLILLTDGDETNGRAKKLKKRFKAEYAGLMNRVRDAAEIWSRPNLAMATVCSG